MWIHPIDTLDLLLNGMIVGIVASAPMGPVGVLAVRRTLNKGRWYGFVTGVGAAFSDIIYALVTGFGLNVVLDFVTDPHSIHWLQLVSTVLLFCFGLYTFNVDPTEKTHPSSNQRGTLVQNAFTGFALTISNPLIIFLFIALFARFDLVMPGYPLEQALGYVAVFGGAVLWWYGLTYTVSRIRERFSYDAIVWINRIIGAVVMVVSLFALYFTLRGRAFYH